MSARSALSVSLLNCSYQAPLNLILATVIYRYLAIYRSVYAPPCPCWSLKSAPIESIIFGCIGICHHHLRPSAPPPPPPLPPPPPQGRLGRRKRLALYSSFCWIPATTIGILLKKKRLLHINIIIHGCPRKSVCYSGDRQLVRENRIMVPEWFPSSISGTWKERN